MIRRPPRSTLFPYTDALPISAATIRVLPDPEFQSPEKPRTCMWCGKPSVAEARSEEHTSELQSRRDLVCRLLLEKKKKLRNTLRAAPINKYISVLLPMQPPSR